MWDKRAWSLIAGLLLAACEDRSLHLKVHYPDAEGLNAGAPVISDQAAIGAVESIELTPSGGYLVGVEIHEKDAATVTSSSRFYMADQPQNPGKKRIEVEQSAAGGSPLANGTTVEGSERLPSLPPLGDLIRRFGDSLQGLRGELEQFQRDLRKIPDSPEAKRLQEEWRRLAEELARAQAQAQESVNKDLLPKLQQEMERLQQRFRRFQTPPTPAAKAPNTL